MQEKGSFIPKNPKLIDIIYSEFDSDEDSDEDPEWLPSEVSEDSEDSETEELKKDKQSSRECFFFIIKCIF